MAVAEGPSGTVCPRASALLTTSGDGCIVWMRGEHDIATQEELSATIARALTFDGDVVLDLSGVEFMAAATVSVILRTREQLRRHSRSLTVRTPSGCARRVLELCGVGDLIDVCRVGLVATTRSAVGAGPVAVLGAPSSVVAPQPAMACVASGAAGEGP